MINKVHDGQGVDRWAFNSELGNRTDVDGHGTGYGEPYNCGRAIGFGGVRHAKAYNTGNETLVGLANVCGTGHGGG